MELAAFALGLLRTNVRRFIPHFVPDLSRLALVSGGFALIWTLVRTGLMLMAGRSDGASQPPHLPDARPAP